MPYEQSGRYAKSTGESRVLEREGKSLQSEAFTGNTSKKSQQDANKIHKIQHDPLCKTEGKKIYTHIYFF